MNDSPDHEKSRDQLLQESDALFRGLVEVAPDALVIVNQDGQIVLINEQTERMFGYGRDELLGRPVEVLVPEASRARHADIRKKQFLASAHVRPMGAGLDLKGRRKNGEDFAVEISLSRPLETEDGLLVISTVRDVSERKQAEKALRDSEARLRKAEARYRSLVEEIPAVTFLAALDGDTNELYVSPQIEALLGFTQKEWLEDPILWHRQLHPDDRERWNTEFAPTVAHGIPFSSVYHFVARNGRVVWVRGEAKVIKDDRGRPLFLQGVAFDITAIKEAEEELRLLNQTLEERVRERTAEAERRAEELKRSNDDMVVFGEAMFHDLKEPLRAMTSYVKLARLEDSLRQADSMLEKLTSLATYSGVRREKKPFAWVECSEAFAAACRRDLHVAIEESGAEVTAGTLPRVWGEETLLGLLFQNLIGNALKYRAPCRAPVIRVEAREQGEDWLLTVTDNGIGIEPQHLKRIFDLGKGSRLNPRIPGHGIGLATCARIVERHGGRIWAESPGPDQGTTLAFTLPTRPPASAG
jgi:PAS domain S-box-containing protein